MVGKLLAVDRAPIYC